MKSYLSIRKYGLEHLVLIICALFLAFAVISCDSESNSNDQAVPTPTPSVPPPAGPTPSPAPTPSATPTPSPAPGGSILEPGGTLSEVAQTFDYVGNGNERQMLDYYAISGLPSQTVSDISTSGLEGSRPAIVFFHGGAWLVGDKEDVLDEPVILDAAEMAGFHLISVGYRLAGINPDNAPWPAQVHDANAAIRWIKQNAEMLDVDPEKLVIVGGSAGAHIAAAVAMGPDVDELQGPENLVPPTSTDVALAFLIFGAYDMNMIVDDAFDLVDDMTCDPEDLLGIVAVLALLECPLSLNILDPLMNCSQQDLDSASPVVYVDSSDPPSYLVHGRDDCTVPFQQTLGMETALDMAGVTNETMIVTGGEHDSMSLMLDVQNILNFIDDNLSP